MPPRGAEAARSGVPGPVPSACAVKYSGRMDIAGLAQFPGGALVERGIRDLGAGRRSSEALLVAIGAGRLRDAGVPLSPTTETPHPRSRKLPR